MTLFKLSVKNLRKSFQNYTIYFATLIIGVAIFYVFNALEKQSVMMEVSTSTKEIIKLMNTTLSGVGVFVSFVLGFLIVYASNFLIKRRKKEFGIYMLLGMSKGRISKLILIETILIGVISLVIGLFLGIIISQGMSVVVADMFEADMTEFAFIISEAAIAKTILYFVIMYMVVLLLNTFIVGKARMINLINASKKVEKNTAKNPVLCVIVFIIASILLGTAYYTVTAGLDNIESPNDLLVQIVKGALGTFMVFWSISGLIIFVAKRNKKFYHKGINSFTIKEFGGRINSTIVSASIICLMMFITICILSSALSIRRSINNNLKELIPVDINFAADTSGGKGEGVYELLERAEIDTSLLKDEINVQLYEGKGKAFTQKDTLGSIAEQDDIDTESLTEINENVMKLSDYNKVAQLYGKETISLENDEYVVICNYDYVKRVRDNALKEDSAIEIGGKEYHSRYEECRDGFIVMSSNRSNFGVYIVPDNTDLSDFKVEYDYIMANYDATDEEHYKEIEDYFYSDKLLNRWDSESEKLKMPSSYIGTRTYVSSNSIGISAMIVFVGIYLGIVFLISSAAILALKELSEAADNKEKYTILRKIGVDEKAISKSLFKQIAMFFGLPLLVAGVHSIFGIQTCMYILETFGKGGILYSIVITAIMITAIYGAYFVITYLSCRNIIKEGN